MTNGRLTFVKQLTPDLISARCSCGVAVLVATDEWPSQFGCPLHHSEWVEAREQEAAEEAEATANAERSKADYAEGIKENVEPHFEQLDASQRGMFSDLESHASFNIEEVSNTVNLDHQESWDEIGQLLDANVLLELKGPMLEPRQYRADQPYAIGASPASRYKLRPLAIKQRHELGLDPYPIKPEVATAPQVDPSMEVEQFLAAKVVFGAGATIKQSELRFSYHKWAEDQGSTPISVEAFNSEMEKAFPVDKHGRWVGLRLKQPQDEKPLSVKSGPSKLEQAQAEYNRLVAA